MNGGARRAVARSEDPRRGYVRTTIVDGEIVELVARNTHPNESYRASGGWVARVKADPSGAEFVGINERECLDAASARIIELRTAALIEREVAK